MDKDSLLKLIQNHHLVSLNTARIKLRNQHPRISNDLLELFTLLKNYQDETDSIIYTDGLINIDN